MSKSIRGTKKARGRPKTTGSGDQIGMRWQSPVLQAIDAWRYAQVDKPSRAEAIRRLVQLGLGSGHRPVPGAVSAKKVAAAKHVRRHLARPGKAKA
jgi:hypothetical protein